MAAPASHPAPKSPEIKINILKPQGLPQQLPTRFFSWMFAYGRFMIIVVEIAVLACFAYRFKLDADLAHLKEDIEAEVKTIQGLATEEALIKQTQQKLTLVKQTNSNNPNWLEFMKNIADNTPTGVVLASFAAEHPQNTSTLSFKISGQTDSHLNVAGFVNNLNGKNATGSAVPFTNIELQSLSLQEGQLQFSITGETK